jgi:hypothetical protein
MQVPAQQVVPLLQAWPQLPQLLLLVWVLTQVPLQFVVVLEQGQVPLLVQVPLQQGLLVLQAAPAATHLLVEEADVGPVEAAAALREGTTAPARPAARILRALRRERGSASLRAMSSNRSALMPHSVPYP